MSVWEWPGAAEVARAREVNLGETLGGCLWGHQAACFLASVSGWDEDLGFSAWVGWIPWLQCLGVGWRPWLQCLGVGCRLWLQCLGMKETLASVPVCERNLGFSVWV